MYQIRSINKMEKKSIYLIDSENVGDLWVTHIIELAKEEDEIVVFYTQKSPHMGYENIRTLLNSKRDVEFVKCVEGRNALDFQLVTDLGYRIGSAQEEEEYIIVTNDIGFDAVVQYWKKHEKDVKRYNGKICQGLYKQKMQEPAQTVEKHAEEMPLKEEVIAHEKEVIILENHNKISDTNEQENIEKKESLTEIKQENIEKKESLTEIKQENIEEKLTEIKQENVKKKENPTKIKLENVASVQEKELLQELISCLGVNNSMEIHNALTVFLGSEKGKQLYSQVKGNLKEFDSKQQLKEEEKFNTYCQLVFSYNEKKETCPRQFSQFVYGAKDKRKNLNSFRSALQNQYGKEKGLQYYSMVKPHVRILNKIQSK